MARFLDIPLELLPIVFNFVLKPKHLAALCLVNRAFNTFATPFLYHCVRIFSWHPDAKSKLVSLFQTLAVRPSLAVHIRKLEIRDFPKGYSSSHSYLLDLCVRGIKNCTNLKSCTWTRDGSLHSGILESLCSHCPHLEELEINGKNTGKYDPLILLQFTKLKKISLIMPTTGVLDTLPPWVSATSATLRSLTILCKASPHVTDAFLSLLSLHLTDLEHLFIVGCPKVTHIGIGALVSENRKGLFTLNLESLSPTFNMNAFKDICHRTQAFRRLRSITLTIDFHAPVGDWTRDICSLLEAAPLEVFQLYATGASDDVSIPDYFWRSVTATHGPRLKCFSVLRMQMSPTALGIICLQCIQLERLFVLVDQRDLIVVAQLLALVENLRTLHINIAVDSLSSPKDTAIFLASYCSSTLTHVGCNTQVWQVQRNVCVDGNGEKYTLPTLIPQENPEIPEQFLVVRA